MSRFIKVSILSVACFLASCSKTTSNSALKDQFSGRSFLYFDTTDRQKVMRDVGEMVVDNYVLVSVKASLGIVPDADRLFADAVAAEGQITDADSGNMLAQAAGNLSFLDRIQKVIAAFQDTHFSVSALVARTYVLNGLQLSRVGNEVRVTGIRSKLFAYLRTISNDPSLELIRAGTRVISIDGVPVDQAASELASYISASTPSSRDSWAVQSLSMRDFRLPERAYSDWVFGNVDNEHFTLRLPYFYRSYSGEPRKDELTYFAQSGIRAYSDLQLTYDAETRVWNHTRTLAIEGYDSYGAPKGLVAAKTWYDADKAAAGNEIHRTGYIFKNGRAFGVLQVFGFSPAKVTASEIGTPVENAVSYISPVRDFVKGLKEAGIPLILDLRNNGGGNPMNGINLLSAIGRSGEVYPSTTRALRVTRIIRQMLEADDLQRLPNFNDYDYDQTALAELRTAIDTHSEYTAAFTLTDDIRADVFVGGYEQPIVALISPMCISACDGMAMLLKASHRATLVGTTSNGTGAGFIGDGAFEDIQWHDRYQLISLRIPNRLFGVGGAVGQHLFSAPDAYLTMNSENRPTVADELYQETLPDFLDSSFGWYEKALSVLTHE